jgi:DNA-binding protein HU-beta
MMPWISVGCDTPEFKLTHYRKLTAAFALSCPLEEHPMATAKAMTKTQLTQRIVEMMGEPAITKKKAGEFLEGLAEIAIKETKKNGIFVLPGIGRLVKAHRKARLGGNPQTGEPLQIKAKTVVKFRVAKTAKESIAPPAAKTKAA